MTQSARLIKHLDNGNTITSLEAFNTLGITQLSSRIGELEKIEYPIRKERITVKNRFNEDVRVTRYSKG